MAQMGKITLPREGLPVHRLPRLCVRTGVPTDNFEQLKFATAPLAAYLFLGVFGLLGIIPVLLMKRRATINLPVQPGIRRRSRTFVVSGVTLLLLGAPAAAVAAVAEVSAWIVGAMLVLVVVAIGLVVKGTISNVNAQVLPDEIVVRAHPVFVTAFEKLQAEQALQPPPVPSGLPTVMPRPPGMGTRQIAAIITGILLSSGMLFAFAWPTFVNARESAAPQAAAPAAGATGSSVSPIDMQVGMCYQAPEAVTVDSIDAISCSLPHSSEVAARIDYVGEPMPSTDDMVSFAEEHCYDSVRSYMPDAWPAHWPDDLIVEFWVPAPRSIVGGRRDVVCVVTSPSSPLSESVARPPD